MDHLGFESVKYVVMDLDLTDDVQTTFTIFKDQAYLWDKLNMNKAMATKISHITVLNSDSFLHKLSVLIETSVCSMKLKLIFKTLSVSASHSMNENVEEY